MTSASTTQTPALPRQHAGRLAPARQSSPRRPGDAAIAQRRQAAPLPPAIRPSAPRVEMELPEAVAPGAAAPALATLGCLAAGAAIYLAAWLLPVLGG